MASRDVTKIRTTVRKVREAVGESGATEDNRMIAIVAALEAIADYISENDKPAQNLGPSQV